MASAVEQGAKYAESHEWVKVEGDTATIGISDFAQVHLKFRNFLRSQKHLHQHKHAHYSCPRDESIHHRSKSRATLYCRLFGML